MTQYTYIRPPPGGNTKKNALSLQSSVGKALRQSFKLIFDVDDGQNGCVIGPSHGLAFAPSNLSCGRATTTKRARLLHLCPSQDKPSTKQLGLVQHVSFLDDDEEISKIPGNGAITLERWMTYWQSIPHLMHQRGLGLGLEALDRRDRLPHLAARSYLDSEDEVRQR